MTVMPKSLERDVAREGLQFGISGFMEFLSFHPRRVFDRHAAQFTSEVIRQAFFQDFFAGFFQGLLPRSTRSNRATTGLPAFRNAAS
jgi:hypothetical protein